MSIRAMDASEMSVVFFTSSRTPLYSKAWTPSGTATYAATCIFLLGLAALFRALLALKSVMERGWLSCALSRRYVHVASSRPPAEAKPHSAADEPPTGVLSANGVEVKVVVLQRPNNKSITQPWRFSTDLPRALIVTATATAGYLL